MLTGPESFAFGVTYCPYVKSGDLPMELWEDDLRQMRSLGFTVIRCFLAWDRIEGAEGVRDFAKLDRILDLAGRHGLRVLLNLNTFDSLGGLYPPPWLARRGLQAVVPDPRQPARHFGAYRHLCLDDPEYLALAGTFLRMVVARFHGHPALAGWNLFNEPFLFDACYCPHTLGRFRAWLKVRYASSLPTLNAAWGSEFRVAFRTWDEVEPPLDLTSPFIGGSLPSKLDWMRFNEENLAALIRDLHALVREADPRRLPITANIAYMNANSSYNHHKFCDLWTVNREFAMAAYSHYTLDTGEAPWERASRLCRIRSSSQDPAGDFLVLETEADPRKGLADRMNSMWQIIAHGGKSLLIWKYRGRVTDSQTDSFNLVGWDGSTTDRAVAAGRLCGQLQRLAPRLNTSHFTARVAILTTSESMRLAILSGAELPWRNAWVGAYRLLWDLNIPANYVAAPDLIDRGLAGYRVLVLPHALNVGPELAQVIHAFVSGGGTVIADHDLGLFDDQGAINLRSPGFGLDALFGCTYHDHLPPEPSERMAFSQAYGGAEVAVAGSRNVLRPVGGEVIASFADGTAAAVAHITGKGRAYYLGSTFFADYRTSGAATARAAVKSMLEGAGVRCAYNLCLAGSGVDVAGVEICTLHGAGFDLLFLLNHTAAGLHLRVGFPDGLDGRVVSDVCAAAPVERIGTDAVFLRLEPQGVVVLEIVPDL